MTCPTCGRTHHKTSNAVLAAWERSGRQACPICITKALHSPTGRVSDVLRCAACGASRRGLRNDTCANCRAGGVEPIPLFDEAT